MASRSPIPTTFCQHPAFPQNSPGWGPKAQSSDPFWPLSTLPVCQQLRPPPLSTAASQASKRTSQSGQKHTPSRPPGPQTPTFPQLMRKHPVSHL